METKSSNAPVVVIAFTVVIIVAMICGMVIWLMQRSMAMNERINDRLLEVRLQEAKALSAQAQADADAAEGRRFQCAGGAETVSVCCRRSCDAS